MPVLKHFTGNCHVYVDRSADLEMAERIVVNAKCQRLGVCNAAETLLVHARSRRDVRCRRVGQGADRSAASRSAATNATRRTWCRRPVPATRAGLLPPNTSADDLGQGRRFAGRGDRAHQPLQLAPHRRDRHRATWRPPGEFTARVDSSAVMVNASTRFNDGGEFGLGAEIGISTDKFHARGPCGLKELTSYKYVVYGNGPDPAISAAIPPPPPGTELR